MSPRRVLRSIATCSAALAVLLFGCDGSEVKVGGTPTQVVQAFETGVWTGTFDGYAFASGSKRLLLRLDTPTTGRVTLGDEVPPEPVDPDKGYPSWIAANGLSYFAAPTANRWRSLLFSNAEGSSYTVVQGVRVDRGLRFAINAREIWSDWCSRQTAYPQPRADQSIGGYACVPPGNPQWTNGGPCVFDLDWNLYDQTPGEKTTIDCGRALLCGAGLCQCDGSDRCRLASEGDMIGFSVEFEGATAAADSDLGPLRLVKQ